MTHSYRDREGHHSIQYLYISFNPVDQLGYSAVDAWFIAPSTALPPAYHPCQSPVPTGCLTHQGSTTVSLNTGPNHLATIVDQVLNNVCRFYGDWSETDASLTWIIYCIVKNIVHKPVSGRFIRRFYITGCIPGRSPLLRPWCQHKSFEGLGTRRRRSGGSRQIELSPWPEPALAHLTQSLTENRKRKE